MTRVPRGRVDVLDRVGSKFRYALPFLLFGGLILLGTLPMNKMEETGDILNDQDQRILELLKGLSELPLEVEVGMGSTSDAVLVMGGGFEAPEFDATWLAGPIGLLDFRVPGGGATRLDLAVYPFVGGPDPERELEISTSEGIFRFTMQSGGQVLSVPLDAEQTDHQVSISCPEIGSPADLGLGSDVRQLCLKLISLTTRAG